MSRVLVIDDDPGVALILKEVLSENGHQVFTANSGMSGLERLRQDPLAEIVLVDMHMPGMSGMEVLQSIRSDARTKDLPVVLVTGSISFPQDLMLEENFQAWIGKPFELGEVVRTVEGLLPAAAPKGPMHDRAAAAPSASTGFAS